MNTKKMIINSILIAIGVILHVTVPSIGLPAQPDFALAMLFVIILINKDYKTALFSGIIIGIFTAMTTKSPGGQIPNIIDKLITCNVMYFILIPLRERISKNKQGVILLLFGTLVSGATYLTSLVLLSGAQEAMLPVIFAIVIPTAIINVVIGMIIFKVVDLAMKSTNFVI